MKLSVRYNPVLEEFRAPIGGVSVGTEVRFCLKIESEVRPDSVTMVMRQEEGNEYFLNLNEVETHSWTCAFLPFLRGLYFYHFEIAFGKETLLVGKGADRTATVSDAPESWQLTVCKKDAPKAEWAHGGVMYHVFVDRFFRGGNNPKKSYAKMHESLEDTPDYLPVNGKILNEDFFGGDLLGVAKKLDYLKELNVSILYLSPIFEAHSNHKYDTGNYLKIDSMFGTEEDFVFLCEEAEKRGIRVVLDGVFNHTGDDSVYFNKYGNYDSLGAFQSKESPYASWYTFKSYPEDYESWWGIQILPQIREDEPSYVEFMCGEDGVLKKWLRLGASGWRLDVVDELANGFLTALCESVREEKEDAIIIGEVWEDASNKIAYDERRTYFTAGQLNSVMNYPLKNAIIRFVREGDAEALRFALEELCDHYPPEVLNSLMNILGTHDTARILTALAGKKINGTRAEKAGVKMTEDEKTLGIARLKVASALAFSMPGFPCIYYGDEAGVEGYEDPFNRTFFPWGKENTELQAWFRSLGALRKHPVFERGKASVFFAKEGVFAMKREGKEKDFVLVCNCGKREVSCLFNAPSFDALSGKEQNDTVSVLPNTAILLFTRGNCEILA